MASLFGPFDCLLVVAFELGGCYGGGVHGRAGCFDGVVSGYMDSFVRVAAGGGRGAKSAEFGAGLLL